MKDSGVNFLISFLACFFIGIAFCGLVFVLYDNGVFIQEYIKGSLTIEQLMSIILIIWSMIGIIVGAYRS